MVRVRKVKEAMPWDPQTGDWKSAGPFLGELGFPGLLAKAPPVDDLPRRAYVDDLEDAINRQIKARERAWTLDAAVLDLKERLWEAKRRQFLRISVSHMDRYASGDALKHLGVECLVSCGERLLKDVRSADRQPSNFLSGLLRENDAAVECVLQGISYDETLALAFEKLNLSRLLSQQGLSPLQKANAVKRLVGELHDTYVVLEASLNAQPEDVRREEKAVIRSTLVWLSETLTMLIECLVDCSREAASASGSSLADESVEQLARSIFFGTPAVESVLTRLIREGRVTEIRDALSLILRKNAFFKREDRLRLLEVLMSVAQPVLARCVVPYERDRVNRSNLERALAETQEAHTQLRTLFAPVVEKLLNSAEEADELSAREEHPFASHSRSTPQELERQRLISKCTGPAGGWSILFRCNSYAGHKENGSENCMSESILAGNVVTRALVQLAHASLEEAAAFTVQETWEKYSDAILAEVTEDEAGREFAAAKFVELNLDGFCQSLAGKPRCSCDNQLFHSELGFSALISHFDPAWEGGAAVTPAAHAAALRKATDFAAETIMNKLKYYANDIYKGYAVVFKAVKETYNEQTKAICLERFVPWRDHIYDLEGDREVHWVVFQDERSGQWRATAVSDKTNRFINRALLAASLRGLQGQIIVEKTACVDAPPDKFDQFFVHHSGFTGGAPTKAGILHLVRFQDSTS